MAPFFPSASMPYAGNFIAEQASALVSLGVQVSVVTFVPFAPWPLTLLRAKWKHFAELPAHYSWRNVPVTVFRYPTLPRNMSLALSSRIMEMLLLRHVRKARPRLIHAHFAYPTGLAAVKSAKQEGIPIVLTVHGSDIHTLPKVADRYHDGVVFSLQAADIVLAVSDSLRGAAVTLSGRHDINVHRIGIDLQCFAASERNSARSAIPELSRVHGPIVLFVGNLLESKGVLDLIRAFHEIRDTGAHLVLVGEGPLRAEVERQVRAFHMQEQVHLLGARPNSVIPTMLSAADVFVLPSHREGLGVSCVEALACECPVIATDVGGIPEVIKHNQTGILVPAANPSALAVELRHLLGHSELARGFSEAGRRLVETQFDLRKNTRALIHLYNQKEV